MEALFIKQKTTAKTTKKNQIYSILRVAKDSKADEWTKDFEQEMFIVHKNFTKKDSKHP